MYQVAFWPRQPHGEDAVAREAPSRFAGTLPATKFALPPEQPAVIARSRLTDALDAGIRRPLTLISAPPGAGKTALLGSWVGAGGPPGPVAWLSLDAADRDRRRFWRGVLEALTRAGAGDSIAELAGHPHGRPEVLVSELTVALAEHDADGRPRAGRLPRGRRCGPRRRRPAAAASSAGAPAGDRDARRSAAAAQPAAPSGPAHRAARAGPGDDARRDHADARGRGRVARRRPPPPAVGAHRGLGGRPAARRAVAARPSGPRRLRRGLRRQRPRDQRLPDLRGHVAHGARRARLPAPHLDRQRALGRARGHAHRPRRQSPAPGRDGARRRDDGAAGPARRVVPLPRAVPRAAAGRAAQRRRGAAARAAPARRRLARRQRRRRSQPDARGRSRGVGRGGEAGRRALGRPAAQRRGRRAAAADRAPAGRVDGPGPGGRPGGRERAAGSRRPCRGGEAARAGRRGPRSTCPPSGVRASRSPSARSS